MTFTLYWLTGKRETIEGPTIQKAFSSVGLSAGAISALDFYAEGDDNNYTYSKRKHTWQSRSRSSPTNQ